jgi:conjugal transfer pilus assembly protein TraV
MNTATLSRVLAISALCAALTGCGSITGLDGTSSYSCKAPEGVKCDSVSGTYYNALQNNLPSQRKSSMPAPAGNSAPPLPSHRDALLLTAASGTTPSRMGTTFQPAPLRAAPRVMRMWIKPWEDADRDLNGESLVYLQVDDGRWLVDHVQRQAREPFAPIRAAKLATAPSGKADANGPARPPGTSAIGADDGTAVTQALKAVQQRAGATTPVGEN